MTERKREIWLDALRILSAFLVIVNHTNSQLFIHSDPTHGTWWASILWYYASKLAVPVFVLVSGACLLHKQDTFVKTAVRFLRILGALLVFSYVYFLHDAHVNYGLWPRMADWRTFLSLVWTQKIADSFWYLYFYLGLTVMLPFLQRMCAGMKRRELCGFILLCLTCGGAWPLLGHYVPALTPPTHFDLPLYTGYLGLFFAGHWLRTFSGKIRILPAAALLVVSLAVNVGLTWLEWTRVAPGAKYWFMDERTQPALFVMLGAISLAVIFRGLLSGCAGAKAQRIWRELGGCAFGVYLLQQWVIAQTEARLFLPLCVTLPSFPAVIVWEMIVFIICLCAAWLMRRIPVLKSLL